MLGEAFPDDAVVDYEPLIVGLLLPDPDDRHVLAAAIHSDSDLLVTGNLDAFPVSGQRGGLTLGAAVCLPEFGRMLGEALGSGSSSGPQEAVRSLLEAVDARSVDAVVAWRPTLIRARQVKLALRGGRRRSGAWLSLVSSLVFVGSKGFGRFRPGHKRQRVPWSRAINGQHRLLADIARLDLRHLRRHRADPATRDRSGYFRIAHRVIV